MQATIQPTHSRTAPAAPRIHLPRDRSRFLPDRRSSGCSAPPLRLASGLVGRR